MHAMLAGARDVLGRAALAKYDDSGYMEEK